MSLYRYFTPVLPNPRGSLSEVLPSAAIASANREVQKVKCEHSYTVSVNTATNMLKTPHCSCKEDGFIIGQLSTLSNFTRFVVFSQASCPHDCRVTGKRTHGDGFGNDGVGFPLRYHFSSQWFTTCILCNAPPPPEFIIDCAFVA